MYKYLFFNVKPWKSLVFVFVFYFIFQFVFFLSIENIMPSLYYAYEMAQIDIILNINPEMKEMLRNNEVLKFVEKVAPQYVDYLKNVSTFDLYSKENEISAIGAGVIHFFQCVFYIWWIIFIWKNTIENSFGNGVIRFLGINLIFYVLMHLVFSVYVLNAGFSEKTEIIEDEVIIEEIFENSNSKKFENDFYSIKYPSNWKRVLKKNVDFKINYLDSEIVVLNIDKTEKEQSTILDSKHIEFLLRSINKIIAIENQEFIEVDGVKGYYIVYESDYKRVRYKIMNIRFLHKNRVLIFEFKSPKDKYEDYLNIYEKVFETLKFK